MDEQLVSVQWAADYCGVSTRTIWRRIEAGALTPLKSAGTHRKAPTRLRRSEVEKLYGVFDPEPEPAGQT